MAKKIVKKRKLKIKNFLMFLLIIVLIIFLGYIIVNLKIKNIYVRNTNYLNDDYVIDLAGIKDYPSFVLTSKNSIKKKIMKSDYVKNCVVKKKFFNVIDIKIYEDDVLFFDNNKNKYVLGSSKYIKEDDINSKFRVPRLNNYVPDKKYKSFVSGMKNIDKNIIGKMSDIEYVPNEFDKDRFVFYMDDGNMVYLTLTKFKQMNYYNEVVEQLEGRKGILYLDSGNMFEIKE